MNWKEFFKPNIWKILLTIVIFVVLFLFLQLNLHQFNELDAICNSGTADPFTCSMANTGKTTMYAAFIVYFVLSYPAICFIFWIISRMRKK